LNHIIIKGYNRYMDHRIEKFLAIVEAGGFTLAAQQIHISQPALSVTMNELEAELGVQLLHRKRGHFGLTEPGQIVYDAARRVRSELQAMRQQLAEHTSQRAGTRIGLLDTVAELLLSSSASNYLDGVEVKVDNSARLIAEVRFARLDVAVVAAQTSPLPAGLVSVAFGSEEFTFVTSPTAARGSNPQRITRWLAFNQASNTYAYFVAEFDRYGIVAVPSFYSTSMDLLKSMAVLGRGVALLPLHFCAPELSAGTLVRIATPPLSRPLWLVKPEANINSEKPNQLLAETARLLSAVQESLVEPPKRTTTDSRAARTKNVTQ
jgi:DNA-binding transcriptional LysR family regulator